MKIEIEIKIKTLLIVIAIALSGCSTVIKKPVVITPPGVDTSPVSGAKLDTAKETVDIDPRLLRECEPLLAMESNNPSPDEVLIQKGKDVVIYVDCSTRHHALIKILRSAFNIK